MSFNVTNFIIAHGVGTHPKEQSLFLYACDISYRHTGMQHMQQSLLRPQLVALANVCC